MHEEVLYNNTKEVWDKCSFLKDDFFLAGGTGLALQIGHRKSIDLDFFSEELIKNNLLKRIEEEFNTKASILVKTKNELTILINDVKLSFIYFPFPFLYEKIPSNIVSIVSIKDIATMKAYSLGRRQSLKDYLDLYKIMSSNYITLEDIIKDSNEKFKEAFNDRLFLEQLLFVEDLEDEKIDFIEKDINKEKALLFFTNLVENYKDYF